MTFSRKMGWLVCLMLVLSAAASAQINGTGTVTNTRAGGMQYMHTDNDDDVLCPLTMSTPFGLAQLVVEPTTQMCLLTIPSIGIEIFAPLAMMPMLPGMQEATVGGGMCLTQKFGGMSPHGSGLVVLTTPIPNATAGSIPQAVAKYKEALAEAALKGEVAPCAPGQG